MKLLLASNNEKKMAEMGRILEPLEIEVLSPADLKLELEVEETGETFAENARIKAEAFWKAAGIPAIADDSGLCVDELGGLPGVFSARYGGEDMPYEEKMDKLLKELYGLPWGRRGASFKCAVCCVLDDEILIEAGGECRGVIGFSPVGTGGFGYDPIFMVGEQSFATMSPVKKDSVSHRSKALAEFERKLRVFMGLAQDEEEPGEIVQENGESV